MNRLIASLAILAAPLLAAVPAVAQDSPKGGIVITRQVSERVRIDRINMEQRIVGFTFLASGKSDRMRVDPKVTNLSILKPGDIVVATAEERTSVVLTGPSAPLPQAQSTAGTLRDTPGRPGAEIARQNVISFRVVAVDKVKNTISLVDTAGGEITTLEVTDPARQKDLKAVNPGDGLTLIDSYFLAISFAPSK